MTKYSEKAEQFIKEARCPETRTFYPDCIIEFASYLDSRQKSECPKRCRHCWDISIGHNCKIISKKCCFCGVSPEQQSEGKKKIEELKYKNDFDF